MIVGIGIDIVDLDHIKSVCKKQAKIHEYILNSEEVELYKARSKKRQIEFLAGRLAVKEAFSKAMGTGIGKTVNFQNIKVINDEKGKPIIIESPFHGNIFVSISHSKKAAVAQVILTKTDH